jgi:hypothetical protein
MWRQERSKSLGRRCSSQISLHDIDAEDDLPERNVREYMTRPILERLCDSKYYTGMYRRRFSEGVGNDKILDNLGFYEGAQGYRSEAYLFPRMVGSPLKFDKDVVTSPSPMVHSADTAELFAPIRVILVFRNGDPYHSGYRFVVQRHIRTMNQLYKKLTEVLKPCCPVTEIYDADFVKISRVDELEHGERYLACEGQGPTCKRHLLAKFISCTSGAI